MRMVIDLPDKVYESIKNDAGMNTILPVQKAVKNGFTITKESKISDVMKAVFPNATWELYRDDEDQQEYILGYFGDSCVCSVDKNWFESIYSTGK